MKNKFLPMVATLAVAAPALAGLYGDTPDAKHAWSVHDMNRPNPPRVTYSAKGIPSDAVVLFDGTKESFEKNWTNGKGGPCGWKLGDEGDFYCAPGWKNDGAAVSRYEHGDCQLHIEWRHDANLTGSGQMRGNSGVFLMGSDKGYEIQVMDSTLTDPADNKDPNYADGQAGAVYAENPPLVNAGKFPGQWQTYDIVFHQPVWEGDKLLHPGSVTVFFNGVLVQDHWEMEGLTTHCRRRPLAPHAKKGPLSLQDHGCVVHYRNIWLRELPSRWANTTHSAMSAKEEDVMALRSKTAAALFAKIDASKSDAGTIAAMLEVISYSKDAKYVDALKGAVAKYVPTLENVSDARKEEVNWLWRCTDVLVRNKVCGEDCPLRMALKKAREAKGWK